MIRGTDQWVEGVKMVGGFAVMGDDGLLEADSYVRTETGAKAVSAGVYVESTPILYNVKADSVSSATACTLSGKVVPVSAAVHLSKVSKISPTPEELAAGEYNIVMPDEEGAWSVSAPDGYSGVVAAWMRVPVSSAGDGADMSLNVHQEEPDIPQGAAVLSFRQSVDVLPSSGGYSLSYGYSCPEDAVEIELYLVESTEGVCPDCGGGGTVEADCPTCGGTGSVESTTSEPCGTCGGSGFVDEETCQDCGGSGYVEVPSSETCYNCYGTGRVSDICSLCGGSGTATNEALTLLQKNVISSPSGTINIGSVSLPQAPGSATLLWQCKSVVGGTFTIQNASVNPICLAGDTIITLADGTGKRLDALTAADMVLGGDGQSAKILRLARGRWNPYHTLYRFEDGTVIDEVHEHRFYNCEQGFWQKLKNWRVGEHARRIDGGTAALVDVERIEDRKEMFGLWVERDSYWANGLLSGDAEANLPLLENATAEHAVEMAASLPEREIAKLMGKETGA